MESPISHSTDPSSSPMPTLTENSKPGRRRRNTSVPSATNNTPTTRKRGARCSNKPKPIFQCSACSAIFKRSEHLVRHYRSHTLERPFGCTSCGTCFTRKDLLVRHQRTCKGVPSRRRRKSVLAVISKDALEPTALMAISSSKKDSPSLKKQKPQSHDRSTSVDSDIQQQSLPDSSGPFASPTLQHNTADTEERSNQSTRLDTDQNVFQNSFIDPLLATYGKHQPTHDLHFLDNVVLPSVRKSITGFNDDENDSDVQSSLFDDDCNSPRSINSSVSSQGSRKPIYNNYSQYPFGLDSDMENEVLDYDRVCHLSTASMKNEDGLATDSSFPYTQYLESKSNQFIKHAFGQPNPMPVNSADYWDLNASNNDHTIDGITMLDSTFTSALRPEWNFNSATSHTNNNDNDDNNNNNNNKSHIASSFGRLINKNLESLFETKKHKNEKSLQSRAELSDTLKCQNYFNLYSVPGSNKVFSNALENASVDPKSAAPKLSKSTDLFSMHLSQYGSSSNGKDLFPGFDYSHVLPNSKSTNAILDFFAGANGSYNGSGNDIFDPEILKASN